MQKYNKTEWIAKETLVSATNLNKIENQLEDLTNNAIEQEQTNIQLSSQLK